MNWLPSLGAWPFAVAGCVGAVATVLIHLLNRRRHQVLAWGAVEFLQQAIKRNRRVIRLRDALLLTLRTLAVLLFGLALARPHYSHSETLAGPQPIHAIVIIDNSLSMSYQTLSGSLLNQAKQAAIRLVERLPMGSHVSIRVSCGDDVFASTEPTVNVHEARSVIEQIDIADATASAHEMIARARLAAEFETNQPIRVVIITDQQAVTWSNAALASDMDELGSLQILNIAPGQRDNAWIAEIDVQDGFAEARTQSTIRVTVQRSHGSVVRHAEVALLVGEHLMGSRSIVLQPGNSSQIVTFQHAFRTSPSRDLEFARIKAALTPDRLSIDDVRHALIPVIPRLPIVFVDQFGASDESVRGGQLGETRTLRRLLQSDRDDDLRDVTVGQRHLSFEDLDAEAIEDARLVIVAGVESPGEKVSLLRRFVEEGGQLFIAAGGDFSASRWQELAWLDGNGILAAPLTGNTIGAAPDETIGVLVPRILSVESLRHTPWLKLPGISEEILGDLYTEPLFFKAIEIDAAPEFASAYRILGRLESLHGPPLFVEREIDRGRVVLMSSSLTSNWNTLAKSNAVVMLDRIVREMIRSTISDQNRTTGSKLEFELPVSARGCQVLLQQPDRSVAVPLESGYLDRERFGVAIHDTYRRGVYEVAALPVAADGTRSTIDPVWSAEVAVNGDPAESDLAAADNARLASLAQHTFVSLAHSGDEISLADANTMAEGLWWWFTLVVLGLILAETLTLVTTHRHRRSVREAEWAT